VTLTWKIRSFVGQSPDRLTGYIIQEGGSSVKPLEGFGKRNLNYFPLTICDNLISIAP